jgi:hypothetical protein
MVHLANSLLTLSTDGSLDQQLAHMVNIWFTWPTACLLYQQMDHLTNSLLTWSTYGSPGQQLAHFIN